MLVNSQISEIQDLMSNKLGNQGFRPKKSLHKVRICERKCIHLEKSAKKMVAVDIKPKS
jgi:hypothetical protein